MVQSLKSEDYAGIAKRMTATHDIIDLQHASTGITTEGGEVADQLKRYIYYGTELDNTNLKEELGDLMWYIMLGVTAIGMDLESVLRTNISKLRARYGEKFSKDAAVNRDLEHELEMLKGIWTNNVDGVMPIEAGTLVDVMHEDGDYYGSVKAGQEETLCWALNVGPGTIVKWRLTVDNS